MIFFNSFSVLHYLSSPISVNPLPSPHTVFTCRIVTNACGSVSEQKFFDDHAFARRAEDHQLFAVCPRIFADDVVAGYTAADLMHDVCRDLPALCCDDLHLDDLRLKAIHDEIYDLRSDMICVTNAYSAILRPKIRAEITMMLQSRTSRILLMSTCGIHFFLMILATDSVPQDE